METIKQMAKSSRGRQPSAAGLGLGDLERVPFLCGQLETMSTAAVKLQRPRQRLPQTEQQLEQKEGRVPGRGLRVPGM